MPELALFNPTLDENISNFESLALLLLSFQQQLLTVHENRIIIKFNCLDIQTHTSHSPSITVGRDSSVRVWNGLRMWKIKSYSEELPLAAC